MLIAIDGGGTKTEALLVARDGAVTNRAVGGPTNLNSVGAERACEELRALLDTLTEPSGGCRVPYDAVFAGLSGAGREGARVQFERMLVHLLPHTVKQRVDSDLLGALSSGIGHADGAVIIAGTGSSALVRVGARRWQIGGWGHLIDDAGSGFDIGSRALKAALRALDGRAEPTALAAALEARLGMPVNEAIPALYAGGKQMIAGFARLVLEMEDDAVARRIVSEEADELAGMARAAARYVAPDAAFPVVMAGSVWRNERLRAQAQAAAPRNVRWVAPALPPVFGAAVEAAFDAGAEPDAAFERRFAASYAALLEEERPGDSKAPD